MAKSSPKRAVPSPSGNIINFFDTSNATTKSGSSRKKELRRVVVASLRKKKALRRMRAVMKALEDGLDEQIKAVMAKEFVNTGCRNKLRPDQFTGIDGAQSANCQLRSKSFGPYGMDKETKAEIEAAGLGEYVVSQTKYEIDAADLSDHLKKQMLIKLSEIPGIPPGLFKPIISHTLRPDSLDRLFVEHHSNCDFVEQGLKLLGTLATRIDYNKEDDDIEEDSAIVGTLINPRDPIMGDVIRQAAKEPEKTLNPQKSKKKAA